MGFFGRVALGSALGGLAKDMKENREYARNKSEKIQDYLYQAGLERRQKVRDKQNELQYAVDFLKTEGMETKRISALLDQNPFEVLRLATVAQEFKEKAGRLTPNLLNQAVKIAEGYEGPDASPSELIRRATPDFIQGADLKKPDEVERTLLQKMLGRDSSEDIMYDAYSQSILGAKGSDIAASINAPLIRRATGERQVTTSYTGLGAIDAVEIRKTQTQILREYKAKVESTIKALQTEASNVKNEGGNPTPIQKRINKLKEIQDMDDDKLQLEAMITNQDIGFGILQEYYRMSPQFLVDQPSFISNDYIPFISGGEDFVPSEEEQTQTPGDGEVAVDEITLEEGQTPIAEARMWFGKEENADKEFVEVVLPDGSTKVFKRVIKDNRTSIVEVN